MDYRNASMIRTGLQAVPNLILAAATPLMPSLIYGAQPIPRPSDAG